jgi:hypothetical protein
MKVVVLALVAGCASQATYRTTRIARPGTTDWLFGAQAAGAIAPGQTAAPLPELAVAARRAVHEQIEVQANGTLLPTKAGSTGSIELAGKARILERGRWSLAVGAAAGYRIAESGGAIIEGVHVAVPVIGGIDLGRHQLVLSASAGYQRYYSSGARPVGVPFAGSSIGFLWQFKPRWALLPELGSARTPTKNFMTEETRLFHAGIALVMTR